MSAAARDALDAVFGADGVLARALPGFESRPGQVRMSQLVERGFLEGAHTIVEAGTGVGKSLAYLVPAMRSGKKVVVSTGTIALQEQLVNKDIPLVLRALGVDLRVELLKGRNHYLCKSKLERMRAERLVAPSGTMETVWDWAGAHRRPATAANWPSRRRRRSGNRSTPTPRTASANCASTTPTAGSSGGATRRATPTSSSSTTRCSSSTS